MWNNKTKYTIFIVLYIVELSLSHWNYKNLFTFHTMFIVQRYRICHAVCYDVGDPMVCHYSDSHSSGKELEPIHEMGISNINQTVISVQHNISIMNRPLPHNLERIKRFIHSFFRTFFIKIRYLDSLYK